MIIPVEFATGTIEVDLRTASADIGPDRWVHLTLVVDTSGVPVTVDGVEVLTVHEPKSAAVPGAIGLFVDIGTRAEFANLVVEPSS